MSRMLAVIAAALVAAFVALKLAEEAASQRAYSDSARHLDTVINGGRFAPSGVAWYAEPINAALLVGGIVLVVGFMLAHSIGQDKAPER